MCGSDSRYGHCCGSDRRSRLIGVVVLWPVVVLIQASFQNIASDGFVVGGAGWSNYSELWHEPALAGVVFRTVIWVVAVVAVTLLLSLALAQLFNQRFPFRRAARTALIAPWAASVVMTALIFRWALDPYSGAVNIILHALGLVKMGSNTADWLGRPGWALVWMMIVGIFVSLPFTTYAILAGSADDPRRGLRGRPRRRRRLLAHLPCDHAAAAAAGDPRRDHDQRDQRLQLVPDHLGDDPRRPGL